MMMATSKILIFLALGATLVLAEDDAPPKFGDSYIITGRILLPYAEIDEPFTAYYDAKNNKSRVDYYGDLQMTLQRADIGRFYKIAYMTNNGKPQRVCFDMATSELAQVEIQSVLPDLTQFQLKRRDSCKTISPNKIISINDECEEWEYRVGFEKKENKYIFLLRRDEKGRALPLYYLMMGYDSLMGSHYDKYEIIYESYWIGQIDPKIFDIQNKYKCRGFLGRKNQALALMNPIREFILGDTSHVDHHFNDFVKKHSKNYTDNEHEINFRKNVFLQNYRFIESHNRKSKTFKLAVNHLADRTDNELGKIRGLLPKQTFTAADGSNGGKYFDKSKYDSSKLPEQWDLRLLGAVTPVKDQAICGSCWSFGITGTIEGQYFMKTGNLLKLSQQQLVDCSWSTNNNGCDGGLDFQSYQYIIDAGGISTEEDYGHYLGVDGKCHDKDVHKSVKISGFYNVTIGDAEAMKLALFNHGPVTIAVDASQKTFTFYSYGIYYDPKCSSKDLDHQVLAVGYGELNGEKYWLVKNSWSTYWGNDGYILISQKNNDCGVLTDATFPIIE